MYIANNIIQYTIQAKLTNYYTSVKSKRVVHPNHPQRQINQ